MRLFLIAFSFCFATLAQAEEPKIDEILIVKSDREMYLLSKGEKVRKYKISLGTNPVGKKEKQGDGKTPEGKYTITGRNPESSYYKSLRVSYPNAEDKKNALAKGYRDPGGDIMIHGLPNKICGVGKAHLLSDWTLGCVAVTCEEIDEIWKLVKNGTKVEIRP